MLGTASTTLEFSFGLISPVMSRGGWLLQPTVYLIFIEEGRGLYECYGRLRKLPNCQIGKNDAASNQLTDVGRERDFCWDGSESIEAVQK
jgi:hypothetical protein